MQSHIDQHLPQGSHAEQSRGSDYAKRRAAHDQRMEQHAKTLIRDFLKKQPEPRLGDQDSTESIRSYTATLSRNIQTAELEQQRRAPIIDGRIETSLTSLRVKRDLYYWRIFRINDLPPEILGNIFHLVASSSYKPDLGIRYRLWLTWVCRRWRSIAISDCTLWNTIWFRDLPPYNRSFAWFERAGTAPLDLRLNERDARWGSEEDKHPFTGEQMEWLLDRLFTKLSQIRMLIVVVDTWPPALVVLDRLRRSGMAGEKMASMERFELHRAGTPYVWIGPGYQPDVHRNPIPLFGGGNVPSLTYVCLNGINIDWVRSPLSNLTTLDLRRIALEVSPDLFRFREMLASCPNLYKLALDGAGPDLESRTVLGLDPVHLPKLRILVLGDFTLPYALYVVANISAPHVRDLTLMNLSGEDYSSFFATITSRFTEVVILTLYTIEVDDSGENQDILVRWLESMPNLGYMRLAQINRHILQPFLRVVTSTSPSPASRSTTRQIVSPKLATIEYQSVSANDIVWFGSERQALGVPLLKIYINVTWASSITREQHIDISKLCPLYVTAEGATTPEEAELMRE